jgi:hypothetical protein
MTWDHDRVEELLAARALDGLDPEEAALAERALVEHVPWCARCREALDGFSAVAGDLGLLAEPVATPETLDARVKRSLVRHRRRSAGWAVAAAASVIALALGGWNLVLNTQLADRDALREATQAFVRPQSTVVAMQGSQAASMVYDHEEDRMIVVATGLPETDGVYRVWCVSGGDPWSAGTLQPDEEGTAVLEIDADPSRVTAVMVTEEPHEEAPAPSASPVVSATVD